MGLYQSNVTVLSQTFTAAGTYNGPSFSAANFSGGVLFSTVGTVTGTSPTLVLAVQIYNPVTATWVSAPALANSLSTTAGAIGAGLNVSSYTPVALAQTAAAVGTVYVGNLLRVVATVGGTGSLSVPVTLSLDMLKRFGDNS